jgi:diguanylate cyclase (GGDEF)-like protein
LTPQLPRSARLYLGAVVAIGLALMAARLPDALQFAQPASFVALLILSSMSAALKVHLPLTTRGTTMSIAYGVDLASLMLLGPNQTMLVAAGSAFIQGHLNGTDRNPIQRTLFSLAALVIAVQGSALTFHLLGGNAALTIWTMAGALAGAGAVYFLVHTGIVTTGIALSVRTPVAGAWRDHVPGSVPSYLLGVACAVLAVSFVTYVGYGIAPFAVALFYLTYRTYTLYVSRIDDEQRHALRAPDLHLATIEALARAIDAKDQTTQMHIRRVQMFASGLAEALGLPGPEIQGIKTAALLHDIGNLAVPEHILSKAGPLTPEEFQKIRIHPQVGAEIIAAVPFPYPVAPLIMSHHERWDGKGYPQGLAGADIPLGARILTIVDYYDAVTTERPYHKALSYESAVGLLKHEAGRALDPKLVPLFVELLPALIAELGPDEHESAAVPSTPALRAPKAGGLLPAGGGNAFENIALAHREIYALYDIAQSMGTSLGVSDTMALISSKLSKIVSWSGCALFLYQPDSDSLNCRFAAGVDAPRLLNANLKMENGGSSWVTRERRTLINGNPHASFEAAGITSGVALNSAIVCPLQYNHTFIGCLALYHVEANHYTEDHRRLLERIAEQAGAVIHNAIVFEQTQEDSLTDPLTGLPNRRSMFVHLSRELARATRIKSEVAIIVMDIDGFKAINDTYGHNVGDRALREVADALQGTLRPYDLCVRYAGDEFIVVLTDCSREAADLKRRELQARIAEIEVDVRAGGRVRLGVSAGAAVFPQDGKTYEELLAGADHLMYRDKAARRGSPLGGAPDLVRFAEADEFATIEEGPIVPRQTVA